ncbi:MAG TPA: adenylate kinase [Firmicutes bacterium]|nr:adenylate kinase [Candidatus Fermentithermobacillaceae bacterium]
MRLLFLGPPGAGKGTQAKLVAEKFGLIHIAPGDIFRQEVRADTDLGRVVEGIMAEGRLVPDDITTQIIEKRIASPEAANGFVLDGFPRNIAQAGALTKLLEARNDRLNLVINLEVPEEELVGRSRTRRVCSGCGKPYNIKLEPPRIEGKCDVCGGALIAREDDQESTVRQRLKLYHEVTEPLFEYYNRDEIVVSINGCGDVDLIFERIVESLEKKGLSGKR